MVNYDSLLKGKKHINCYKRSENTLIVTITVSTYKFCE